MHMKSSANRGFLSRLLTGAGSCIPFDSLEQRQLMSAVVVDDFDDLTVNQNAAGTVIDLATRFNDPNLDGTIIKFQSVLGTFHALLYDTATPNTVTNFLKYADGNLYDNTIIHRSVSNFVVQGGGFGNATSYTVIPVFGPVLNEPGISNVRGTIAMAKLGGNPNSATSQWFFNLGDNSANLNNQNGGFTVFGRVIGDGMTVVDAIAAVPVWDASVINAAFDQLPLRNFQNTGSPTTDNTVSFSDVSRASKFTYTVTAADPTLVSAQIIDGRVSLSYLTNRSGTTTVTVRATAVDSTTGTPNFVEDTFTVNVVAVPPTIEGVRARNGSVGLSGTIVLEAENAADADRRVERVQYWFDLDANGEFDAAHDQFITTSIDSANSFRASFSATGFGVGTHRFFARAQDSDNLFSPIVSTTVRVDPFAPTIGGVKASVAVLPSAGSPLTLSANNARDRDGTIALVQYFRDNGDGTFDADTDSLLGTSNTASNKYAFAVDTTSFEPSTLMFFARAQDSSGFFSTAVATTVRINAVPTITTFDASSDSAERVSSFDLIATGVTDDLLVKSVEFWRDVDGNGSLDTAVDRLAAKAKRNSLGEWTAKIQTKGFALGETTFFAVAIDSNNGRSAAQTTEVTITNAAPTMTSISAKPLIVANLGDNVTLSGKSPKDKDGTIANVQYFLDDGNGTFSADDDTLLGESTARGFSLVTATGAFSAGLNTVFAWATDNSGTHSVPASVQVRINNRPTIDAMVVPDTTVLNNTPFTLAATGVADSDGTIKGVDFFIDLNGDGEFQITDRLLGKGRLTSAGVYSLTTTVRNLAAGTYSVFARATDNIKGVSTISEGEILVG